MTRPPSDDWRKSALCAEIGGDLFFSDDPEEIEAAKTICGRCKVQESCLTYALANGELSGVIAGLTAEELRALPGYTRAGTVSEFVPETDEQRMSRIAAEDDHRSAARERHRTELRTLTHPSDRKATCDPEP